ncbi:MAG: hypothetical protein JNJ63_13200 [Hyphomonadaceae bacterium]|nr:hypothetical protein [Hyphomonadaceae bacterium]
MATSGPDARKIAIQATRDAFANESCDLVRMGAAPHKIDAFVATGQISLVIAPYFRLAYGALQLNATIAFVDREFERLRGRDAITQESLGVFGAFSANFPTLSRSAWIERSDLSHGLAQALAPYMDIVRTYPRDRQGFQLAVSSGVICDLPSRYFLAGPMLAERRRDFLGWLGVGPAGATS